MCPHLRRMGLGAACLRRPEADSRTDVRMCDTNSPTCRRASEQAGGFEDHKLGLYLACYRWYR